MRAILALLAGLISVVVTIGLLSQAVFVVVPALGAPHGTTLPQHSLSEFLILAVVNLIGGAAGGAVCGAIAKRKAWVGPAVGLLILTAGIVPLFTSRASGGALFQYAILALIAGGAVYLVAQHFSSARVPVESSSAGRA